MLMWDMPPGAHAGFCLFIGAGGLVLALPLGNIADDNYFALLDAGPVWWCLALGLLLGALVPVGLRRLLPRVSYRTYPASFVMLSLAAPLFCVAVGFGSNRWLDSSPPARHLTCVTRHVSSYKGPGSCELVSWRRADPERFVASYSLSDIIGRCASGTRLVAVTRRGALGWEWVDHFAAAP